MSFRRGHITVTEYFEDQEEYLTGTFETYLELRTDAESIDFEDLTDFKAFLDQEEIEYEEELDLTFPPEESDDLGKLVEFVNDMGVVE